MSEDSPESENIPTLVTIAEAAAHLGIHEKRLRRLLTRTEYSGRTRTGTRTTRTGERRVCLLPTDLLTDIEARLLLEIDGQSPDSDGDNEYGDADTDIGNGPSPSEGTGTKVTGTRTAPRQVVMSAFYERLLQEKEARIAELSTDKEQLYRLLGEAQANLAREQALRSLPMPATETLEHAVNTVPETMPEAPETVLNDTERHMAGVPGMKTPSEAVTGQSEAFSAWAALDAGGTQQGVGGTSVTDVGNEKRTWWARLWGR